MHRHLSGLRRSLAALSVSIACLASVAVAQPSNKAATAMRTGRAPAIDGRMDEPLWAHASVTEDFTQLRPTPGAAPSERTRIRIVYDDDAIHMRSTSARRCCAPTRRACRA